MKTKIQSILIALLMGAAVSISAQSQNTSASSSGLTPEQVAQRETDWMTKDLSLTSDQQDKIQAINLKYAQQRSAAVAKMEATGKLLTSKERKELKEDTEKSIKAEESEYKKTLTSYQYKLYKKNKDAAEAELRDEITTAKSVGKAAAATAVSSSSKATTATSTALSATTSAPAAATNAVATPAAAVSTAVSATTAAPAAATSAVPAAATNAVATPATVAPTTGATK